MTTVIALDAMGGDHAPLVVLAGAEIVLRTHSSVRFLLFGDEAVLNQALKNYPLLSRACEVIHAGEAITNFTKPSAALRQAAKSGMGLAIQAVADNRAHAVISAGNTGALMVLSKIFLKTLDGIDRPAIAKSIPTQTGKTIVLDLGANAECRAEHLVQFALMGEVLAKSCGIGGENPTLGLLNIGSEESKGIAVLQAAFDKLKNLPNFHGFVEGDDITKGTTDVVVTDGFSGNIALKTMEGTAKLIKHFLTEAIQSSIWGKIGYLIARPAFSKLAKKIDPRLYNGAILLGLKGIAVKSHGGTDEVGFAESIRVALDLCRQTNSEGEPLFNLAIKENLKKLEDMQSNEQEESTMNVDASLAITTLD